MIQKIKENRQVRIDTGMPTAHHCFMDQHMLQVQMSRHEWREYV